MPRPEPSFLADENYDERVVELLRSKGVDIQSIVGQHPELRQASDAEVLAFATSAGRAVLTYNRKDFRALHHQSPEHAGVGLVSEFHDPEWEAESVFDKWQEFGPGQMVRISRKP